jgi:hypothetical protein
VRVASNPSASHARNRALIRDRSNVSSRQFVPLIVNAPSGAL